MKKFIFLLLLLPLSAQADDTYLRELVLQAEQQQLAAHQSWLNLGHYRPNTLLPGYTSEVDSPGFFLAADGKTNPQAELQATLAAFFSQLPETEQQQNPQCAFIARYRWLRTQLDFDQQRLPEQHCARYEAWHAAINPERITLVFPSAFVNSPASMFGHTLLRIDQPQQDEQTRLTSYAINFAAQTDEVNGFAFAIKGLFGGYTGMFSIMPYYEKVKEYRDLENRDIWEYQLNFTATEIDRLLEHAWEMGPHYFDYYFFDENCASQLLSLFDVARPGLQLAEEYRVWAIPADTLRTVLAQQGMLHKVVFRPSRQSEITTLLGELDESERDQLFALSRGRTPPQLQEQSAARRARILEGAYQYTRYLYLDQQMPGEQARPRMLKLLQQRSDLDLTAEPLQVPAPAISPDQGHGSARIDLLVAQQQPPDEDWSRNFYQLNLRPAYHDLLDHSGGYQPGSQINFFDLRLRHYEQSDTHESRSQIQALRLFDVISLAPRDHFFSPRSWKGRIGFERLKLPSSAIEPMYFTMEGGYGLSWGDLNGLLLSLKLDGQLAVQDDLQNDYTVGAGPSAMLLGNLGEDFKLQLAFQQLHYSEPLAIRTRHYNLGLNLALGRDIALRLAAQREEVDTLTMDEASMALLMYF